MAAIISGYSITAKQKQSNSAAKSQEELLQAAKMSAIRDIEAIKKRKLLAVVIENVGSYLQAQIGTV